MCVYWYQSKFARMAKLPARRLSGGADLPAGRQARYQGEKL